MNTDELSAELNAALTRLGTLSGRPATEHLQAFEDVHRLLEESLADLGGAGSGIPAARARVDACPRARSRAASRPGRRPGGSVSRAGSVMVRRSRLDSELVRRGMARSREQAVAAIAAGRVSVAGIPATKAATIVDATTSIALSSGDDPGYASRGAHKLVGAFDAFGVTPPGADQNANADPNAAPTPEPAPGPAAGLVAEPAPGTSALIVAGRRCLDVGASTGGSTDVLLRYGAAEVVAVDVGYGQLIWRLQSDPRVRVLDRTNARHLTPEQVGDPVGLVVGDLSFISLELVLPAVRACAAPDADFVLLVKPQFEVGRELLGPGGVVRDVGLHASAVQGVAAAASRLGLGVRGVAASPLPGPAGNVEYLLWLRADAAPDPDAVTSMIEAAIEAGPAGSGRAESGSTGAVPPGKAGR